MTSRNPTTSRRDIERFLRVDHAGERVAQQIYKGQLAVLANHEMADEIQHMMDQEVEHLETFDSLLNERKFGHHCRAIVGRSWVYTWRSDCSNGTKSRHGLHHRCGRSDRRALSKTS